MPPKKKTLTSDQPVSGPQKTGPAGKWQEGIKTLEMAAGIFSPLVIILFCVLIIISLDGYANHFQKVTHAETNYIISTGIWEYFHVDDTGGWIKIPDDRCMNTLIIETKYYSSATLATLESGKEVRVRYSVPDCTAYLEDYFYEFKYNLKGLQEFVPILLFCIIVLTLYPDFLYLGLIDVTETPFPAKKS